MSLVRAPDRVPPAPALRPLPEPLPLRRMVGPGVILVGLSIGSGEFVLWPRLTAEWGFNLEHFVSFYLLALVTLALFCLLAAALLEPGAAVGGGLGFIRDEADAIEARFGPGARRAFLGLGVAVLFSTALALIDAVARVASDLLALRTGWSMSRLYFALVWVLVGFGMVVLATGFDQPLTLLVLSASLDGAVMFLYSGHLLWLNPGSSRPPLRPSPLRVAALVVATVFFGYFSALTVADRLVAVVGAGG